MRCEQHNCERDAVAAFTWPGTPTLGACLPHVLWAAKVAVAMGFELVVGPLRVVEEARARDAATRLDPDGHEPFPTAQVSPLAEVLIEALEARAPPGHVLHGALKVALLAEANAIAGPR